MTSSFKERFKTLFEVLSSYGLIFSFPHLNLRFWPQRGFRHKALSDLAFCIGADPQGAEDIFTIGKSK